MELQVELGWYRGNVRVYSFASLINNTAHSNQATTRMKPKETLI